MSSGEPAVLVMAADPAPELSELLGGERVRALGAALRAEAERWAHAVAPGRVHSADGALAEATAQVLAAHGGPLLVVWPLLTRLRSEHASGALGDLDAGCELVIGPVIDGGLYILGVKRPLAEVVEVADDAWTGREAMPTALAAGAESGRAVGLLRAERALREPSDVRAALADPLLPEEIGRILRV